MLVDARTSDEAITHVATRGPQLSADDAAPVVAAGRCAVYPFFVDYLALGSIFASVLIGGQDIVMDWRPAVRSGWRRGRAPRRLETMR